MRITNTLAITLSLALTVTAAHAFGGGSGTSGTTTGIGTASVAADVEDAKAVESAVDGLNEDAALAEACAVPVAIAGGCELQSPETAAQ